MSRHLYSSLLKLAGYSQAPQSLTNQYTTAAPGSVPIAGTPTNPATPTVSTYAPPQAPQAPHSITDQYATSAPGSVPIAGATTQPQPQQYAQPKAPGTIPLAGTAMPPAYTPPAPAVDTRKSSLANPVNTYRNTPLRTDGNLFYGDTSPEAQNPGLQQHMYSQLTGI